MKLTNDAKSMIETFAKHPLSGFLAFGKPESVDAESFPTRVRGRFPSLDGLRAVAILLVVQAHVAGGRYSLPGLGTGHFPLRFAYGHLGVQIFFVISGFLITTLLLQEQDKQGRISLKQFYIRRALRILPASYVFMLVLIILAGMGVLSIPQNSFLASFLYVRNYFGGRELVYRSFMVALCGRAVLPDLACRDGVAWKTSCGCGGILRSTCCLPYAVHSSLLWIRDKHGRACLRLHSCLPVGLARAE